MSTYTAIVATPYGDIEVEHDGNVSNFVLIERALKIGAEQDNLKNISESLSAEKTLETATPDEEESAYKTDLVNVIGRTGAGAANLTQDLVNGVADLIGYKDGEEIIDDDFKNRANAAFVDLMSSAVGEVNPKNVIDEDGNFKDFQTAAGTVGQMAPYVLGGAGIARGILAVAPKLPILFNGILSGVTIDNILYREEEGNLAKQFADAEILEGVGQDILEFMATDEADSVLEQRMRVTLESAAVGGVLEGILRGVKGSYDLVFPSAGTIEEQVAAGMDYLKSARENVNIRTEDIHSDLKFSETPEGVAQVEMQASKPLSRYINKITQSRGYWTPKAYNLFRDKEYAERQLVREAENIANRLTLSLKKMPVDSVPEQKINEFLEEIVNPSSDFYNKLITRGELEERVILRAGQMKIPEEAALELLNARELIDTLSARLANSSIPNPDFKDKILSNVGQYIRRSYRMFEDAGFKPDENLKHDVVEQLRATKIASGMDEDQAYEEALGQVNKILNLRTDYAGLDYFQKGVRVNKEILTGKKDIDVNIRQLMGEITAPDENIILTVGKMAKLVETNKFADNFFELGYNKYIFDEPITRNGVDYGVPISGTNSKLDGKIMKIDGKRVIKPYYTTPEIAEALAGRQAIWGLFDSSFFRGLGALKGASQSMKTVGSHITHARNVVGGAQFALANGINPFQGGVNTFRTLVNAAKNSGDKNFDALYEKYLRLGVTNTNIRINEFRQLLNEGAEIQSVDQLGGFLKNLNYYGSKKITDPVVGAAGKTYKAAEKIYMGVDDFYKINAFHTELDTLTKAFPNESLEVLEERAAQIIQDTFPNYDKVPNGIKAFRNLPVGSFVSFPAEIIRTSYHILKQAKDEIATGNPELVKRGRRRLAGFATSMSAWQGMAITGGYLAGLGTEEQEAVQTLSHTPWSKATRIPIRTDDGKIFVADTQFLDSYSVLKEPIMEAMHRIQSGQLRGEAFEKYVGGALADAAFSMLKPYTDEAIFSKALGDIYFAVKNDNGRTPEGKQLFPEDAHILEKTLNGFTHVAQSFLPGSYDSLERALVQADVTTLGERFFDVEPARTGATGSQKFDRRSELVANLTGVKFTPLNVTDRLYYAAQEYKYGPKTFRDEKPKYDKPAEDVAEAAKQNIASSYADQQDLYVIAQESIKMVGFADTVRTMVDAGIGINATRAIINNRFYDTKWEDQNAEKFFKTNESPEVQAALSDIKTEQLKYLRTPLIPVDEESVRARNERDRLARGGEVKDVPNAPMEPDERINKVTGLPYNETAGPAFMDEEDPMRRLQLSEGGITRRFAVAKGGLPKDMYRRDGSIKSAQGFLGPVKNLETGKTMTELSIDLEIGGKNVQIPTMVPTLTSEEIEILQSQNWEGRAKELPRSIVRKAVDHARKRMDAGLNPFYQDDEGREGKAKGGKIDKKKMACNKPRRTPNHPKKSHVVKACEGGKEKIIRFGEQGAKTAGKPKAGESARMKAKRKSFKARHRKNIKRGKMSAAYWADKVKW